MIDPFVSLITMWALSVGAPFFTGVGSAAGTEVGKYLGERTKSLLQRVIGPRIARPEDLQQKNLEDIIKQQASSVTLEEQAEIKMESARSLSQLMNLPFFLISDLNDFYYRLQIQFAAGMMPKDNPDFNGDRNQKINFLVNWAMANDKLHLLIELIQKKKPFLFEPTN